MASRDTDTTEPPGAAGTPQRDTRAATRRAKQKATKDRLLAARDRRIANEALVLSVAASGASFAQIARQTGMSRSHVHRLYHQAMDRVGAQHVEDFKAVQHHRLGLLLQATWADAMENDAKAIRSAVAIIHEMNLLEDALGAQRLDITGSVTVRREVSVRQASGLVARIQAARVLKGEADLPALHPGAIDANSTVATNGHHANGHDSAVA